MVQVFARSDYPKDIRGIVQELNQKRVEMADQESNCPQPVDENDPYDNDEYIKPRQEEREQKKGKSIWAGFVDEVRLGF